MLKDKTTESKKLFEAEHTSNRITQHSYNNTPCTLVKANNDSNQNTVYKIPEVHIFFKYNFLFLIIRYVKNLNLFFDFQLHIQNKQIFLSTLELLHGHFLGVAVREDCHTMDVHHLISTITKLKSKMKSEFDDNIGYLVITV